MRREALTAYEAQPPVRVSFESGAAPDVLPGAPQGTFAVGFDAWPIPETRPVRWYVQPDGSLGPAPPAADGGASAFTHDPAAGRRGTLDGGPVTVPQPDWRWPSPVAGSAVSWLTPPLDETLVMESYVQCGWLRASHRALRSDATALRPVKTHRAADVAPLAAGEWHEVRVELMPFVHIFRAGSRLRLTLDTPGDSMARWRFRLLELETPPVHAVAHQAGAPCSVLLPVITGTAAGPGVAVPTPLPECHALRGQPCRVFEPFENVPFE